MYIFVVEISLLLMIVFVLIVLLLMISDDIQEDDYLGVYECGFDSLVGARQGFSYRFFLLGVLFIVFDVEVVLMLSIPYLALGEVVVNLLFGFVLVLLVGTVYEVEMGSMDWV